MNKKKSAIVIYKINITINQTNKSPAVNISNSSHIQIYITKKKKIVNIFKNVASARQGHESIRISILNDTFVNARVTFMCPVITIYILSMYIYTHYIHIHIYIYTNGERENVDGNEKITPRCAIV